MFSFVSTCNKKLCLQNMKLDLLLYHTFPPPEQPAEPPKAPEVDGSHPEVIAMVDEAIKEAEKQPVTLSPEVYVEILDKAIKEAEKEMREKNTEGPL
jgi:hypothetical protein